ncbi:MAG: CHASE2 domain-containing protein [Cyanobacteriota bacterium]|nr:CHASE2 domain-containing protein [Cyanobacteriota bacterium]
MKRLTSIQRKIKNLKWRGILTITPSVAGLVIVGSASGAFRLLEWAFYDQLLLLRPPETMEKRIAIVTIDESDIQYAQQWPMSDRRLSQLIRNLKAQQPHAIALDIYRDIPVEPGHSELVEVFKSTPNLIGVEKVAGDSVSPPPALQESGQVAAADLMFDGDGKVRRGLVLVGEREGLGIKPALTYLEKQGISLEVVDADRQIFGLGKAVFVPLTGKESIYRRSETGGYQILLNYRGELDRFPTISLEDALENRIPEDFLRDRIVFIGGVAPSLNDLFQTPYTSKFFQTPRLTPGVVVHANLTSQVLSAALEGRAMLRPVGKLQLWLWIVLWSGCSAVLGATILRGRWVTLGGILLCGAAVAIASYVAFQVGLWLPAVAPLLAVAGSAIATIGYVLWDNLMQSYRQLEDYAQTLEQKVEERTAQLADANAEITLLNQRLQAENLRLSAELDIAKRLQQMVLPNTEELQAIETLEIAGFMEAADEVGGDYYDVLQSEDGVKIAIGDVTGHGLESGVLMIMAQTAVRTLQKSGETDPVKFLNILNQTLYDNLQRLNARKEMTLVMLDYSEGTFKISGQHEEVLLVRQNGEIETIDTMLLGFPLGLEFEIADFIDRQEITFDSGDILVLYTDGITEAEDLNRNFYSFERLCEIVRDNRHLSAEAIRDLAIDDVRRHIGQQKVLDDITLVVLKQK